MSVAGNNIYFLLKACRVDLLRNDAIPLLIRDCLRIIFVFDNLMRFILFFRFACVHFRPQKI